jgi:hypothetical protein
VVRGVREDGVTLELDQLQRPRQVIDDAARQVLDDAVGVVELSSREESGVPRDVGEQQVSLLHTLACHVGEVYDEPGRRSREHPRPRGSMSGSQLPRASRSGTATNG